MAEPKLRVLVVDDERFFREAIRDALVDAGLQCEAVTSDEEALVAARDPLVAVVVLDVGLGEAGGIELLRRLRAERPAVRVIVLSAHTDHELVLEALRLEASDYLAKPLHDEELVLSVRRALAGYDVESSWRRLRERLRGLEAGLSELVTAAGSGELDPDAFCAVVAEAMAKLLGAGKTSVMLLDEGANELRVAAATGSDLSADEMDAVALGEGVAGVALSLGEALLVDDVYSDARFSERVVRDGYESNSLAVAPLRGEGRALGVLCATDGLGSPPFGDDELALLRILAIPVADFLLRFGAGLESEDLAFELPAPPDAAEPGVLASVGELSDTFVDAEGVADDAGLDDASLAREMCEVLTLEIEPERVFAGVLRRAAQALGAPTASLLLIDNTSGELVLEREVEGDGPGERRRLPRSRGLTGTVLQAGALIATPHPERDPRFDPEIDTARDGKARPMLCVPLRLRGKVLGVFRAFPEDPADTSPRRGELLGATLSAAVRNVLLYRSLLETIDELADARREAGM
jgi:DNA-binding response OmpR family regulator